MSTTITGWKVLTHDYRSPLQGGEPVLRGELPCQLPTVALDTGVEECAPGWNFCRDLPVALRIAGLWPNGRPSRAYLVEAVNAIERDDKCRATRLTMIRESTEAEVEEAILSLSEVFGDLQADMANEQMLWRSALSRPNFDQRVVEDELRAALKKRGLEWKLQDFDSIKDMWDARNAGAARDAWYAWAAGDAGDAKNAWDAETAWTARAAWHTWAARDTWDAGTAAWAARNAGAAWAARAALTLYYAAKREWIVRPHDLLTAGIRGAYENGLEIALPVEKDVLGWAMVDKEGR